LLSPFSFSSGPKFPFRAAWPPSPDSVTCPPLETDITQEVLQNPNSSSKQSEVLERTNSMTGLSAVILESTNLDQVVELSNSQSNSPCSIELSDSEVDLASKKQKRDGKKPKKKVMTAQENSKLNGQQFQTEGAARLPWAEGLVSDGGPLSRQILRRHLVSIALMQLSLRLSSHIIYIERDA